VSWKSKKQSTVSRSCTESEYRSLAHVSCEIIWIQKVLFDLGYKSLIPVKVFCDNESAIKIAQNPVFHERTKHFEVDLQFVREKVENGTLKLLKVNSSFQVADVLTKSLVTAQHEFLVNKFGLVDPFVK